MRILYIYGTSRFRRMYLHNPGLTHQSGLDVTCVNGMMEPRKLKALTGMFDATILHGYQCYRQVNHNLLRKRAGIFVFVPSNDSPWFNGRNTQAVKVLKPHIILPEQRVRIDWYKKNSKYCEWFPPACCTDVFRPIRIKRPYDIAFAGTMSRASKYGKRNKWIRALAQHFSVLIQSGVTQGDFNKVYNQGHLAFHMSQFYSEDKRPEGTAYRIFEVGGIGRPLLLDPTYAIKLLFEEGKHFIGYRGWDDLVEKCRWALANRSAANGIGRAMKKEILDKHTYKHRGVRLVEVLRRFR